MPLQPFDQRPIVQIDAGFVLCRIEDMGVAFQSVGLSQVVEQLVRGADAFRVGRVAGACDKDSDLGIRGAGTCLKSVIDLGDIARSACN